jgi:hypothetical protein
MEALTACLQEITTAEGYKHDLETSVFRGRVIFGDSDPLPMLSLLDVPIPLEPTEAPKGSGDNKGGWELIIQGFVNDDKGNPTDPAHVLMADVKKRLAIERCEDRDFNLFGMGNHITGLEISQGIVRPPDEISSRAYFWLSITLIIVEDLTNPYED